MKYAVKFTLDTDGFTNWDDDQIEDPDITFSIVRYPSIEEARKAVNQDFIDFRDNTGFYSNDTVKSRNGRWFVANDMNMYGKTAVAGAEEAYAVSYEVSGDCEYASMTIESVSPAPDDAQTHMESDLEEGCIEGIYICTASQCNVTDEETNPLLDGLSLDKCLENHDYPELEYLYNRYGEAGLEKVFGEIGDAEEEVRIFGAEPIKRLAAVSKACATEMEICASTGLDGFEKEDLFKAIYLRLNFGEEFTDTLSGDDFVGLECGCFDIEDAINFYFEPELLKKYGLEEVTERIIKALNSEYADEFWCNFDIDEYPNFLNDLIPLLNEHIAYGSVDASNVLTKALRAKK